MSDVNLSPNMNLPVPEVGVDPGPDWANNINASLGILDQHNHSTGQGVQINPSGLNINSDLPMNSNNLTLVNTVRFVNLLASLAGSAPNLGCLYEAVNDLYFNDGAGNVVQITKAGSVNATSSGISSGTATASFVGSVLVVDAAVNTPANVQGASFLFGNNVSGSNYLTLQPPNSMASNYSVTLPPPNTTGNTVLLNYDTSNNIGLVASGSINGSFITPGTITQNLLAPRSTGTTAAAGGVAISNASSGAYSITNSAPTQVPNMSCTLTTTGRPVQVFIQPDPASGSSISVVANSPSVNVAVGTFVIKNGSTILSSQPVEIVGPIGSGGLSIGIVTPASSFSTLDMSVNGVPGTYTYNFFVGASNQATVSVPACTISAYEI